MDVTLKLDREIRIDRVEQTWKRFQEVDAENKGEDPIEIDFGDLEIIDGAGFQLTVMLLEQIRTCPQRYKSVNLNEQTKHLLENSGYSIEG